MALSFQMVQNNTDHAFFRVVGRLKTHSTNKEKKDLALNREVLHFSYLVDRHPIKYRGVKASGISKKPHKPTVLPAFPTDRPCLNMVKTVLLQSHFLSHPTQEFTRISNRTLITEVRLFPVIFVTLAPPNSPRMGVVLCSSYLNPNANAIYSRTILLPVQWAVH
jgi:hypothetical protein